MSRVRCAHACLWVAFAISACNLNPRGDDPSSATAEKGHDGGGPIFAGGGMGGVVALPSTGGSAQGGAMSGAGGASSQGGRGGAPEAIDGGTAADAGHLLDGGPDARADGAPRNDGGPKKEAGKD